MTCELCGSPFTPTFRPSRNRPAQRFCSRQCGMLQGRPTKPKTWCSIPGCIEQVNARSYCKDHYRRWRYYGDPLGQRTHRTRVTSGGYLEIFDPQYRKRVLQHRLVMEQILGRPLLPNENVHHLNGDRTDNRPENLELWVKSQPSGQRVTDRVQDAVDLLRQYAPHLLADSDIAAG